MTPPLPLPRDPCDVDLGGALLEQLERAQRAQAAWRAAAPPAQPEREALDLALRELVKAVRLIASTPRRPG